MFKKLSGGGVPEVTNLVGALQSNVVKLGYCNPTYGLMKQTVSNDGMFTVKCMLSSEKEGWKVNPFLQSMMIHISISIVNIGLYLLYTMCI